MSCPLSPRSPLTAPSLSLSLPLLPLHVQASWIKKHVDAMRSVSARKFTEAANRPLGLKRTPSSAALRPPGGGRAPPVGGVGNVPIGTAGGHFITPQMRLQLLESAVRLRDDERVQLGRIAKDMCPTAVEVLAEGRETKIDVDALDPKTFLKLDMHVRRQLAQAALAVATA